MMIHSTKITRRSWDPSFVPCLSDCGRAPRADPQAALPASHSQQGGHAQDQEEGDSRTAFAIQVARSLHAQAGPVGPAVRCGAQQAAREAAHQVGAEAHTSKKILSCFEIKG